MLLIPVWTVYLHATAHIYHHNRISLEFSTGEAINIGVLTLVFIGTYVVNQIFDIESDRINRKLFFLPDKIISLNAAWVYYAIVSASGIVLAVLSTIQTGLTASIIVTLGLLYSIPGIRLKDRPVAGLIANAIAYGFLVPAIHGLSSIALEAWSAVLPYMLAIATGYILTTIPDQEGDHATEKRTVAVLLGPKKTLQLALLVAILTIAAALFAHNLDMIIVSGVTAILIIIQMYRGNTRQLLFICKFPILLLTVAAGLYFPFYLLFLLLTTIGTRAYYKKRFGIVYPKLS
ncbi:MAG: UbiA family prenyltransferase [Candidatus Zixiibacteriota bacterium]